METLSKINLEKLVEDYPHPEAIVEMSSVDFSEYLSHLSKVAEEYGPVRSFPGGVEGYLLFLMLANKTIISAQESDFEDFSHNDLSVYKHCYNRLYQAVEHRFESVFKK